MKRKINVSTFLFFIIILSSSLVLIEGAQGPPLQTSAQFQTIGELCQAEILLTSFPVANQQRPRSITIDSLGNMIFVGADGTSTIPPSLAAYDLVDGHQVWKVDLEREFLDLTFDTDKRWIWVIHGRGSNGAPDLTAFDVVTGA